MSEDSPLLSQYRAIKAEHPDTILFFRIGDFYEMFERDAEVGARELELTLTSKPVGKDTRLPLAGVPWRQAEAYAARLTRRGYRVAMCDQLEDPRQAKGIVKRGVTRVLSPGTVLPGDEVADAARNRYLAVLRVWGDAWSVALADLGTGEMEVGRFATESEATEALLVASPREILCAEGDESSTAWAARLRSRTTFASGVYFGTIPGWTMEPSWGEEVLRKHLGPRLEGFGLDAGAPETAALGALVGNLRETQGGRLPHLATLRRISFGGEEEVTLDEATLRHLEVIEPTTGGGPTLFGSVNATKTPMGARALRRALVSPLRNPEKIRARQDAVACLALDGARRERLGGALGEVGDLERLLGRVALHAAGPREVLRLGRSLAALGPVRAAISGASDERLCALATSIETVPEVSEEILRALVDEPPLRESEGDLVRPGYSEELDGVRAGASGARDYLAGLQEVERKRTGIGSLRVAYNRVFGYYLEVTRANLGKVPAEYERRQTLANAERFTTPRLREAEARVLGAEERARALEAEILEAIETRILLHADRIRVVAAGAAEADLYCSFAAVASSRGWVRPEVLDEGPILAIEAGRHPVLERIVDRFIPNDFTADSAARFFLLTGPNMGGKSTYLRQTALLVLLAQAGSYVPARAMRIAPVDGIYSRVGASDRISEGLSTFMVEMVETAAILRRATPNSLLLLDEVGRGTSTYDGLSIAWAVTEFLLGRGSATLFATHYHEMIDLARVHEGVRNLSVAVREWNGEVVFLHEIREGPADRSYGIEVARRAGLPEAVVRRAAEILRDLEIRGVRPEGDQLDLFAPAPPPPAPASAAPDPRADELRVRLALLDPDGLSPREAHAFLADLAARVREGRV